jgi:replicative DNA helicase
MDDSQQWENASPADLKHTKRERRPQQAPDIERLPPHSMEAEVGILSCMFINPREVIPEVVLAFGNAGGEVFYDLRHYTIFNTMVNMFDHMLPVDVITVMQRLKDNNMLEQVGGIPYLSPLPDNVPSAANISYYIEIVYEKYLLRRLIHTCTDVVSRVYNHESDVDRLFDEFEREALQIRAGQNSKALPSMMDNVKQALQQIEDYAAKPLGCIGLTTGFADLDKMTSGLMPGEMWVIAARPSLGKTSLAMNIAEHVALDLKLPVGVFSLETTATILTTRMICSRARVNLRNVKDGYLADRDYPKLTGTAGKLSNASIWIDDETALPIDKLRAKARRMAQQYGIKLFVIDYLQLCNAYIGKRRIENRAQEVAEISSGIKRLAKELNVPVIALSQVDRGLDKGDRKPVMSDLRESAAIEQDADLIGFLYKPSRDDKKDYQDSDAIPVNLLIAKQKNGPKGEIPLIFLQCFTRFESAAKISDEDVPNNQETLM